MKMTNDEVEEMCMVFKQMKDNFIRKYNQSPNITTMEDLYISLLRSGKLTPKDIRTGTQYYALYGKPKQ